MFWVREDFQKIVVTFAAANIFGRAGAFAFQTNGILRALLNRQDSFNMEGVFPTVAEVVFVDELESLSCDKLI